MDERVLSVLMTVDEISVLRGKIEHCSVLLRKWINVPFNYTEQCSVFQVKKQQGKMAVEISVGKINGKNENE